MKYPQLVSTRAVSAISDWLVTQLDQLGVDASSVYSRLLLSLLHTPLQINALDLAEISDNKIGSFARNKQCINKCGNSSNSRRFSAADTEALKRLAAIDSLIEAVSSDQQLSKIESLVDELSLKLRKIEEQNGLDDSAIDFIGDDANVIPDPKKDSMKKKPATPEDPAKRYFSAFPALSDQSAKSFSQQKSSWPRVDTKAKTQTETESTNAHNPSASIASVTSKKKPKRKRSTESTMASTSTNQINARATKPSASIKPTTNRNTRGQINKNQLKKNVPEWDTDFDGAWEMGRDLIREFVMKQKNRNRSISESEAEKFTTPSDDSESDKRNCTNRNECEQFDSMKHYDDKMGNTLNENDDEVNLMRVAAAATSVLFDRNSFDMAGTMNAYANAVNLPDSATFLSTSNVMDSGLMVSMNDKAIIRSEGYSTPDTLSSLNELAPRRLYERDVSNEPINCAGISKASLNDIETGSDCVDSGCDENNYLAAFEAKFDHSVEALWNDCKQEEAVSTAVANGVAQPHNSFWFDYYRSGNDNELPHNSATIANKFNDFSQMEQQATYFMQNMNNKIPFVAVQSNSLTSNGSSIGGVGLTASIWSDNPNNTEDDVSFYANAKLWEKKYAKQATQSMNFNLTDCESGSNINVPNMSAMMGQPLDIDIGNSETSNFSKWSDGSFETPFVPIKKAVSVGPQMKQENKIRKYLFGNTYFNEYSSSSQMMDNTNSGSAIAQNELSLAENSFGQKQTAIKRKITLANHSAKSCFKEVEPLSYEAKQELLRNQNIYKPEPIASASISSKPEGYLSEKTRFRPIKQTYVDGYTFDISDELDQINYERSASGALYYDSEVYREYCLYDDDDNGGRHSNAEKSMENNCEPEFVLKYCVRQNDMSCQTDNSPPKVLGFASNAPTIMSSIAAKRMQTFDSLNSNDNKSPNLSPQMIRFRNNAVNQPKYQAMPRLNEDELDQMADISQIGWNTLENRQCCNDNNSNMHALWQHCDTCSEDLVVSLPANRLLKDELSADGDEIMSDLKCLQDLYIGNDYENVEDDGLIETLQPKAINANTNLNTLSNAIDINDYYDDNAGDGYTDDLSNNQMYSNVGRLISDLLQPERAQTLVQAIGEKCQSQIGIVNPLDPMITNQMHNTKDIIVPIKNFVCNTKTIPSHSNNESNTKSYFGSLWAQNDNSIWHKELPNETESIWSNRISWDDEKAADPALHFGGKLLSSNKLSEQWEHANLGKIWTDKTANSTTSGNDDVDMNNGKNSILDTDSCNMDIRTALNGNSLETIQNQNALQKFMDLVKEANETGNDSTLNDQNVNVASHKKMPINNRFDRKRRHSATSQNYFDRFNYVLNNCESFDGHKKMVTKTFDEYDDGEHLFDCGQSIDKTNSTTTTTTAIITCKYWTAGDSFCLTSTLAFNNNNNIVGNTENILNCYHKQMQQPLHHPKYQSDDVIDTINGNDSLAMHPTTFLKQVAAMVSRPLTR